MPAWLSGFERRAQKSRRTPAARSSRRPGISFSTRFTVAAHTSATSDGRATHVPAILVPYPPLQSVTSVNQTDTNNNETVWASSNYVVDTASAPGRIGLSDIGSWPTGLRSFQPGRVRFVAGWTSPEEIPDSLRQAVALQIGWFSENREPKAIERDAYEQLIAPFSVFSAV
jgi:uncharacterized phiE125 gp8 family phage protein